MISGLAGVDNNDPGKRDYFEACLAYLIPMDPMARKKAKADFKNWIGGVVTAVSICPELKKGKGESGVELSWHKNRDFCQFFQPQNDELIA